MSKKILSEKFTNNLKTNLKSGEIRKDDWTNVLTYMGVKGKDRTQNTSFSENCLLGRSEIETMYLSEGITKRIVDLIPDEMTRQWFYIDNDPENLVLNKLDVLEAQKQINIFLKWDRLYGGALLVLGLDDGGKLEDPLKIERLKDVSFIHVFDKEDVQWFQSDLYSNPQNPKFGTPEYFSITPPTGGTPFKVHETRTLRLKGQPLPARLEVFLKGWGASIIQSCYSQLRNVGTAYGSTCNILQDFIQTTIKMKNLMEFMASGNDDLVKRRLDLIDQSRSVSNTILLDDSEEYNKIASSVGGLDQLLDRFALALSSVTGIPYSLLMGQPPSGLQATGDADIRLFYDKVKSEQQNKLRPILEKIIKLIMLSRNGPFKGKEPEKWRIIFNPLWQMTEKEIADYRKVICDTDVSYINAGVLDPIEVATSRFGGESYSSETIIDIPSRQNLDDNPIDEGSDANQAQNQN